MKAQPNDQNAAFVALSSKSAERVATDALSQVLNWVRLRGEAVLTGTLTPYEKRTVGAGPGRFYLITTGALELDVIASDSAQLLLQRGDLVLLPQGSAHRLTPSQRDRLRPDDSAPGVAFIEGLYRFDGGALPPVLAALPGSIIVPAVDGQTPYWLSAISHFLLEESSGHAPGSHLMVSRLIDLLVIRALRSWAVEGAGRSGRLAALADERVAHALSALHNAPYRRWTVADLARASAMSRSGFAERFTAAVGESPLRYLARWRLHLASGMLEGGGLRISEVAQRVGYSSDAAFSRAYKARFGHRPGEKRG